MIILDTDHLTVLGYEDNPKCASLASRLKACSEPIAITVISWEEQVRGWLAEVNRAKSFLAQVSPYSRLIKLVDFFLNGKYFHSHQPPQTNVNTFENKAFALDRRI